MNYHQHTLIFLTHHSLSYGADFTFYNSSHQLIGDNTICKTTKLNTMLAKLHHISDQIILRKTNNWANLLEELALDECVLLFQHIQQRIDAHYELISLGKRKNNTAVKCLYNLYHVKNRMSKTIWFYPIRLPEKQRNQFYVDIYFYLMLCATLIKASEMFSAYISPDKNLAQSQLLPYLNISSKRMFQLLQSIPITNEIQLVLYQLENNNYLHICHRFDQLLQNAVIKKNFPFIPDFISCLGKTPLLQCEEEYLNHILQQLFVHLENYLHKPGEILKIEVLQYSILTSYTAENIHSAYTQLLKETIQTNPVQLENTLLFWKSQSHCIEEHLHKGSKLYKRLSVILKHIQSDMQDMHATNLESGAIHPYIIWDHNPKDFVRSINAFINNGYINVKGERDMIPILKVLNQFVKVKKQNNSGNLSFSSLLSYFKKASCGDL